MDMLVYVSAIGGMIRLQKRAELHTLNGRKMGVGYMGLMKGGTGGSIMDGS